MRYIKLFEELSRIVVTPEEKASIKKITNRYISLLKDTKSDIKEKLMVTYSLDTLRRLTTKVGSSIIEADGYKIVDGIAKQWSSPPPNGRGVPIVFDRDKNCFTTASGKALVTFNIVSDVKSIEYPGKPDGFAFYTNWKTSIYINHKTGHVFNDPSKNDNANKYNKDSENYVKVWDFTGSNIVLPVDQNRLKKKDDLLPDIFLVVYHEFIHAKDPLSLLDNSGFKYSTPSQQKSGIKGIYSGHPMEMQTMANNLLEVLGYYFERTLRGDTDGGGLNYGLSKDYVINQFIPVVGEVRDFINCKRDNLNKSTIKQLSGTNKNEKALDSLIKHLNIGKRENPNDFKSIQGWMREDIIKFIEMYNKKVSEINKSKEKGQELPILKTVI